MLSLCNDCAGRTNRDSGKLGQNRGVQDVIAVKSVPLRRRLLYLAAAGILPIALMSGLALLALFEQQRSQAARSGLEIARALSIAIDADIKSYADVIKAANLNFQN